MDNIENRDYVTDNRDYATTDTVGTTDHEAYPNHGVDGNNAGDPAKGGVLGAIGGAAVGAAAGGPVGAVIGAVAGGLASGAGVAAADRVDNDNSPNENRNNYDNDRVVDARVIRDDEVV